MSVFVGWVLVLGAGIVVLMDSYRTLRYYEDSDVRSGSGVDKYRILWDRLPRARGRHCRAGWTHPVKLGSGYDRISMFARLLFVR